MTSRQKEYRANRILGMDKYNAARAAKYSESYCKGKSYKFDELVGFGGIKNELIRQGCTNKFLSKRLIEGLNAIDLDGSPDVEKRRKSAELILKVMGAFTDGITIDQSQHRHITYVWANEKDSDSVLSSRISASDSLVTEEV